MIHFLGESSRQETQSWHRYEKALWEGNQQANKGGENPSQIITIKI